MATLTYTADRNERFDNVTETNGSGKTMTTGLEVNLDLAKFSNKQEAFETLDKVKAAIMASNVWTS